MSEDRGAAGHAPPGGPRRPPAGAWTIGPSRPGLRAQASALVRRRAVFGFLVRRAVLQIHRQAVLGIGWLVIQPLALAIPTAFIMGSVFGISTDPVPLPLFILVGLSHWLLFHRCVQWMTKSVQTSRGLLGHFHVPGLLVHAASAAPAAVEYLVILAVTAAALGYYHVADPGFAVELGWRLLGVLPALAVAVALAFGITCVSTILNALARDTWLTLRYVLSLWMLATPVLYPPEAIPGTHRAWLMLNPLAPAVELYRWAILGVGHPSWLHLSIAAGIAVAALAGGVIFFARNEWRVAP